MIARFVLQILYMYKYLFRLYLTNTTLKKLDTIIVPRAFCSTLNSFNLRNVRLYELINMKGSKCQILFSNITKL